MHSLGKFNHVIVGGGPCGASVLDELLTSGVPASEILFISILHNNKATQSKNLSIFSRAEEIRNEGVFAKGNAGDLKTFHQISSPGEIWGVSCLPYSLNWHSTDHMEALTEAYARTCASWGVQATINEYSPESEYPITGEVLNTLERKDLANYLVEKNSDIEHSRLALKSQITGNSCSFDSNCFTGCDQDVPYRPSLQIRELHRLFQFNVMNHRMLRFEPEARNIILENDFSLEYQKLYLSTGVRSTLDILKKSDDLFNNYNYLSSSVQLRPFLVLKKSTDRDFNKSFLYTDLVSSITVEKKQIGLIQIYLPTHEIGSRILSTLPKPLAKSFQKFPRIVEMILRHIGVLMLFHPGTEEEDSKKEIENRSNILVKQIRKRWVKSGIFILGGPRKYLLNEETMHLGAIGLSQDLRGLESAGIKMLADNSVYVCDTSLLPSLPPGPVTSIAAAFARSVVAKTLSENDK